MAEPVDAWVAVGSNLGDRAATIESALRDLADEDGITVVRRSRLYEYPSAGAPGPDYLNGAIQLETTLDPRALLARLLDVERRAGRERRERWGPRTLDLDLLLYGDAVIDEDGLEVPHPRMRERRFVLEPLAEIAPTLRIPGTTLAIQDLATTLMDACVADPLDAPFDAGDASPGEALPSPLVIADPTEAQAHARRIRHAGRSLGFVPTMGALHDGHLALVRASTERDDATAVSIFVNPLQFDDAGDLAKYPRDLDADVAMLAAAGVDFVFTPTPATMYPDGFRTYVTVEGMDRGLCGRYRAGHFRGVTTVVAKLFNVIRPDRAYFGAKDYQQVTILRRLARDLDTGVDVVTCPTVREPDGLAMSSRNARLTPAGRTQALALSRSLERAAEAFASGERDVARLALVAREVMEAEPGVDVQYVDVVDADSLEARMTADRPVVIAVAAFVDGVRLIDNRVLGAAR